MSNAKELKTGNKGAKRATGKARYLLTQEQADMLASAGMELAGLDDEHATQYAAIGETVRAMLAPLSGKVGDDGAVEQWRHMRECFIAGYAGARVKERDDAEQKRLEESGGRAWTRMVASLGLDKPQTQKAADLAAKRKAEREAAGNAEPTEQENPLSGAGDDAARAVQMGLSKLEAHLIAMVRAGKYEMAAQCIADMAAAK